MIDPIPPKLRQKLQVRKDIKVLCRRRDFNETALLELARSYEVLTRKDEAGRPLQRFAHRYAKRLLALHRAGLFSYSDVINGRWEEVEARAASLWVSSNGEPLSRHDAQERATQKQCERVMPKHLRPFCSQVRRDGQPCGAKAIPHSEFCRVHRRAFWNEPFDEKRIEEQNALWKAVEEEAREGD